MVKYKFTGEKQKHKGVMLKRIISLVDLNTPQGQIKAGTYGGWIQSRENLSSSGECWIADEAKVYDKAYVHNDALVMDNAEVHELAIVKSRAVIKEDAQIYGSSIITGNAVVTDSSRVYGNASIGGYATLYKNANISSEGSVGLAGVVSVLTGNAVTVSCSKWRITVTDFNLEIIHKLSMRSSCITLDKAKALTFKGLMDEGVHPIIAKEISDNKPFYIRLSLLRDNLIE